MKRTRIIYKGLDLDSEDMIIVISEMSCILYNEVRSLEDGSDEKRKSSE